MNKEHQQKMIAIRQGLIDGHRKYLDGAGNPDVAMCRQKDIAFILERAITKIDELLQETGVSFN